MAIITGGTMSAAQIKAATTALIEQARIQREIGGSFEGYVKKLKEAQRLNKTINETKELERKLEAKIVELQNQSGVNNTQAIIDAKNKLIILEKQKKVLESERDIIVNASKEISKAKVLMSKGAAEIAKGLGKLPGLVSSSFGKLKGMGLFEMDKAIKTSGLQMGILSKQSKGYQENIRDAAASTNELGIDVIELAKIQASYSEELGRTVILGQRGSMAMAEMASATVLGAEGAAKMAAEMDSQGLSASDTSKFVEKTMNNASKMGLNASKVVKNVQNNIKLLNKYNFKGGVDGLAKMSALASKLGTDMNFASSMADKLWDVEGAVDMSAQLQVMGGAWADMADPFQLMYKAANDLPGLMNDIAKAASQGATFDEEGNIKLATVEMRRLKVIAQATGEDYDKLVTAGKNLVKLNKLKSQIGVGVDPELQEYMANTAQLGKNGTATIEVDGSTKLLSTLSSADKAVLREQMLEKATLAERAKSAQTFDDSLNNLINMFKTYMLPIVDGINDTLKPLVSDIFANKEFKAELKSFGKSLGEFARFASSVIKTVAEWAVALGPKGTLAVYLGAKGLMSAASWILNGRMLAMGFNSSAGGGLLGGGGVKNLKSASKIGKFSRGMGGAGAGLLAAGFSGYNEWTENSEKGMSTGRNIGNTATRAAGAGGGAWGGAALGATIGTMVFPGVGTAIGGLIGGIAGGMAGDKIGDYAGDLAFGEKANDGVFPKLGADFSKKRALMQNGKIHPIDNKDDLMAMKPGGVVDKTISNNAATSGSMKIEFAPIKIEFGKLELSSPGAPGQSIELLRNPEFISAITRTIHTETARQINGGKNKG